MPKIWCKVGKDTWLPEKPTPELEALSLKKGLGGGSVEDKTKTLILAIAWWVFLPQRWTFPLFYM